MSTLDSIRYQLESKPGSSEEKKEKKRGELEVRIQFTVKAGSLTDLSKGGKHKGSLGKLAQSVGECINKMHVYKLHLFTLIKIDGSFKINIILQIKIRPFLQTK